MQYLLMLYADEQAGAAIPAEEMERVMKDMAAYQEALEKAGAFVMTSPLARTKDARTLSMEGGEIVRREDGEGLHFERRGGELKVHDGPYAETREQLGGFYIIEADSIDDAVGWAKRCPAAQWGSIEVRAMMAGFEGG